MNGPKKRVAVVTGGSRGLGLALTTALVTDGWTVVVDGRDPDDLAAAIAGIPGPGEAIPVPGDVSDPAHRARIRHRVAALGRLDVLVNNASVLGPSPQPALMDYPLDVLRTVYEVNVVAPLALVQTLAPLLTDGAAVVNITSDAAVEGYEGWGGYGSSKAALEQLSQILAAEHPQWRVYWVDPGDMNTRMHQEAFPGEDISDRPDPEASVPGVVALITGSLPSGRYQARSVAG
ncbi:MAG: SDR family NAD(P)-dependent oxidoreductase [Acidimicrobiia bacterium]